MAIRQNSQRSSDGESGFTPDIHTSEVGACLQASFARNRLQAGFYLRSGTAQVIGLVLAFLALALPLPAAQLATPPAAPPPQVSPSAPAQPPPSELPKLVAQLSAQPALSAADCAKFAGETLTHGQNVRQSGQPVKPGIVQDGLAAVDRGERLNANAAAWPELRSQLQDLLKPPPPPPQQDQQKDEQKQEEQKKNQQQQQQEQKKDDQQKSEEQQQREQQAAEQKSEEQKRQEQQQQQAQQQPPPQPPNDNQKIGGEKPKNEEAKEHPELTVPLQKLEQVRDKDSPAELFELLHSDEAKPADQPKKDW